MTILPLAAISANYANIGGKFRNLGGILFNYDYVTVTSVKFSINTVYGMVCIGNGKQGSR